MNINRERTENEGYEIGAESDVPFMPKATAIWLIDNTGMSFQQIADFCHLHILEVKAIADGEIMNGVVGLNPIKNGQLTQETIDKCTKNKDRRLKLCKPSVKYSSINRNRKYIPMVRRQDKPNAISWLDKNHPEIPDSYVIKLIGTTKVTIAAVRNKTHWNSANIKPKDPISLGLCTRSDLEQVLFKVKVSSERTKKLSDMM